MVGDTLVAELTIPEKIDIPAKYKDRTLDEVVSVTINCILYNSFTYNSVKYCDLKVLGNSKYLKLSKVYKRKDG